MRGVARFNRSTAGSRQERPGNRSAQAAANGSQTKEAELQAFEALNELVTNCVQANAQFVDPEFAPSNKVLFANGRCRRSEADQLLIVQHYERNHGREIQWRRPGEIWQRPDDLMMEFSSREEMILTMRDMSKLVPWKVFQSDPNPMDISQGALGNCWFCGSLAAVAEKPDLVKALFVDSNSQKGDLSPQGAYLVRLCDGGEWRYIVLDDNFPCNTSNMLAYSGARRNQLWVPLVEKAFAKIRGCYEETEGGNPCEGLRLLTGWPSIVLHLQADPEQNSELTAAGYGDSAASEAARYALAMRVQASCPFVDEELLWIRLVSACSANLILCGSCGHVEGISKEQYRGAGLSPSHCYSIVHVATAKDGAVRLVKLRNPWGTGLKWKGDFADDDTANWTPEVKAEVGATDLGKDGGIFWMKLQDIVRYFNSITICPFQRGWHEFRHTAEFPQTLVGPQPAFMLGRHRQGLPTEALISMMQPEERASREMMTVDLGVALFRVPAADAPRPGETFGASAGVRSRLRLVDSIKRKVTDTMLQDAFLEEGEGSAGLLAVPLSFNQRIPAGSDGDLPFSSGSAGAKRFTFSCFSARELPSRSLEIAPELVRDALVAHVKKHGSIGSQSQGVRLYKLSEAGLVVYLENTSINFVQITAELTDVFNVTVSRGIQADSLGNLSMNTRDEVPPMHGMLVFVAAAMPAGHTYRFNARFLPLHGGGSGQQHRPPLAQPVDNLHSPFFLEGFQQAGGGYAAPLGLQPEGNYGRHRGQAGDPACEQQ
jgi:calpain-15